MQAKHDAYCEVLDDATFEAEEAWMDNCMKIFMQMKMKVADYVENRDDDGVHDSSRTDVRRTTACKVQIENPELPRFSRRR